jgi:allantoin racemase
MPTALIINPNTSQAMSANIRSATEGVFRAPWKCQVVNAPAGPESLESWRDYHLASVTMLPLLQQYPDVDGIVLACFGDPGLYLLKEIAKVPVVGIAEAGMSLALLAGGRFGILAGMHRAVQLMDALVRSYGLEARYAGTVSMDMRVLSFEADRQATIATIQHASQQIIERGADVILLGCAGLTGFVEELAVQVPAVLIDPVEVGCRMLQAMVDSRLNVSHSGLYSRPAIQRMHNLESVFSPAVAGFLKDWEKE